MSETDATGGASAPVLEQEVGDVDAAPSEEVLAAGPGGNGDNADPDAPVVLDDLGGQSFSDAVDATIVEFDDGDIVTGKVVKIDSDEVLLDIGYKSEGVIPSRELSIRNDVDPNEVVSLDEELEALVLTKEDKDGRLILSKKRAQYERAWGTIEEIKEKDGIVEGPVIEVVKGGLILDIGLRGFLPASLVDLRRVRDLHPFVGRKLECKIIELDKNRNNVVLSRRAFLEETQREQRDEFLANLKPGEVRAGVVSSVVNFGAFVDLGGMDGLVHVSELSWKHVDHPSSVVQVGDEVTVQVLDVDLDARADLAVAEGDAAGSVAGVRRQPPGRRARLRPRHEARAVRRVRAGRRRHRGSRPHLRDGTCTTSRRPSRSSRRARSSGSRSSTSTSIAAASRSRSSRPPRAASSPPSTRTSSVSTRTTSKATTSGPRSVPTRSRQLRSRPRWRSKRARTRWASSVPPPSWRTPSIRATPPTGATPSSSAQAPAPRRRCG